jgi:uncharacterized protein (TIGR02145 family)
MKKYYFVITTFLVFLIGLTSCSNEETKTQNQVASRPAIPIQNNEVQIGTQIWMTKNLNVTRYRNGDPIPQVTDPTQWRDITTGAWCYYQDNTQNRPVYGRLYNWYAVSDLRGLAPAGWHIPSQSEFETLTTYLGGMVVAGSKLKSIAGWQGVNEGATNSTGFSGLPGGRRWYNNFLNGGSTNIGIKGCFWSSTMVGSTYAYRLELTEYLTSANTIQEYRNAGCSVRCIKD